MKNSGNPDARWRMLENLFDAVAVVDSSRELIYCNHRFRKLSQVEHAVPPQPVSITDILELPDECWEIAASLSSHEEAPVPRSVPFKFKSGANGFGQLVIDRMTRDAFSAIDFYVYILRDITVEMQSKSQLDENEKRLAELRRSHAEAHFLWRLAMETPIYLEPSAVLETIVKKLRDDLGFADACFLNLPAEPDHDPVATLGDHRVGSRLREVARSVVPSLQKRQARVDVSSIEVEPYGRFWVTCFRPKLEKPFFLLARSEPSFENTSRRGFLEPLGMQMTQWLDNRAMYVSSITDALTGLFNRRHFDSRFAVECILARERRIILTLLLIDVDHFKDVNDRHGHPGGDAVLKSLGALLRDLVRTTDIPARVGGEEFAVLLFDTSPEDARIAAEKVRKQIEDASIQLPDGGTAVKITVSCGIAGYLGRQDTPESVYAAADAALYQAKAAGRNKIVVSGDAVTVTKAIAS